MALSRLLLPKPGLQLHFHKIGLPHSTRWYSTSPSSSGRTVQSSKSKKQDAGREQRAVATEAEVKKYMELHPGLPPTATKLQGGSWHPPRNQISSQTSDSATDRPAFEVNPTQNSSHNTEFGEPESKLQTSADEVDSNSSKESISTSLESHVLGENSSRDVVDATACELTKTSSCPNRTELVNPESIVRSSGAIKYSLRTENKILTSGPLHMMGEIASKDLVKMTAPEVSKVHISSYNFEFDKIESAVPSSVAYTDSHSYEKNNSVSADSHEMGENFSEDQLEVKLENGHRLLMEAIPGILGEFDKNKDSETEHLTFAQIANADSDVGKDPTSSYGASKVTGLAYLFMNTINNQSAGEVPCKQSNYLTPNAFSEYSDEPLGEDTLKGFDIKGLIGCIKELPSDQSAVTSHDSFMCNITEQVSSGGSVKRTKPRVSLQDSDAKTRQTSLKSHVMDKESQKLNGTEEGPSMGIPFSIRSSFVVSASNDKKSKTVPQVPILLANTEDLDNTLATDFTKKRLTENKVLVRFLFKESENSDIVSAFKDCGSIVKIEQFSSGKGSIFKDAYLHFKTSKGLQKALKKTDLMIRNADVIVEATSFAEDAPNRISIPELIGDPDVPAALIKNPIRTVKIQQLTHDISSQQLQEAFAFCNCGMSSFFLGSSSSVAYVEFKTEDAKERAIAKHSMCVSGKPLLIFRIDAPRTTVVRISNINSSNMSIWTKCDTYGKVKKILFRCKGMVDVHFKLCEWPNMLRILNSLNGMEVDGHRWNAQPAPVFPPEVIQVLWGQPDERRHVMAAVRSLVQKVGDPLDMTEFTELTAKYCGGLND